MTWQIISKKAGKTGYSISLSFFKCLESFIILYLNMFRYITNKTVYECAKLCTLL